MDVGDFEAGRVFGGLAERRTTEQGG